MAKKYIQLDRPIKEIPADELRRALGEAERAILKRELNRIFNSECIRRGEFSLCRKGIEFNAILN